MKSANADEGNAKKRAKVLKLIGSAILLSSFVTQNFLYDRWNSRATLLEKAGEDRSLIDKSVLLNEVLYFTASASAGHPTDDLKSAYIREAARKLALSSIIPVETAKDLTLQEKLDLSNGLLTDARGTNDYSSFLVLVSKINDSYGRYAQEIDTEYKKLLSERATARTIYLSLNITGTLFLLSALALGKD
jgi:hypothetical protein